MWQGLSLGGRVVHHLMRRYVLMGFQWFKCLWVVLFPFSHSLGVDSANNHCRLVLKSLSPQNMPRFVGCFILVFGWFGRIVSLAQSRFGRISQLANNFGSWVGKSPLFCAVAAKKGRLLRLDRVASLSGKWVYSFLVLARLAVKWVRACDLVQKSRSILQFFAK